MLFLLVGGLLGCGRTFRAETTQPNPMAMPTETLRSSEKVTIVTGDMELEAPEAPDAAKQATPTRNRRYPLINQASFTIVSRDRLRFHVQIDHKWQECSSQGRDPMGRCIATVGMVNDGWKHRQTLGTLSVFRGNADFVFYQRNLMSADVQKLRLVVKRTGEAFEFVWKFQDQIARE
jgi:hypothetical protein